MNLKRWAEIASKKQLIYECLQIMKFVNCN